MFDITETIQHSRTFVLPVVEGSGNELDRVDCSILCLRVKHLSNCLEELVKLSSEKVKLDRWLNDAEATLNDMHKRTNQLSRLRDVTDRYKVHN